MEGSPKKETVLYSTVIMGYGAPVYRFYDAPSAPRPMRTRSEKKRQEIIDIATPHFLRHGYSATSISEIAAELGGSKATLYGYFPSKQKLFAAVIKQASDTYGDKAFRVIESKQPLPELLQNFGAEYLKFICAPSMIEVIRCLLAEAHKHDAGVDIYRERLQRNWLMVADLLEKAMRQGQLRKADPWQAAMHLKGLLDGGFKEQLLLGVVKQIPPRRIKPHVAAAVSVFLGYYGK